MAASLVGHVFGSYFLGRALLGRESKSRGHPETVVLSLLLGMSAETFLVACVIAVGLPLRDAAWCAVAAWLVSGAICVRRGHLRFAGWQLSWPRWYEVGVLLVIAETAAFAIWQIARTPIVFDDTLTHWSGRARALYGGVNWSVWPASPAFLAQQMGHVEYPLQIPVWRAITAWLSGGWNDVVARADSLLFLLLAVAAVWSLCLRLWNLRWLAALAVLALVTIPLLAYHAAAGYADIAIAAYACVALASVLRGEPMLSGFTAAAMCWVKNDGLVLVVPALLAATVAIKATNTEAATGLRLRIWWESPTRFLLGFSAITPWLLFNGYHGLGLTPHTGDYRFRLDALKLLWNSVVLGPAHGVFWIAVLVTTAAASRALIRSAIGRAALVYLFVSLAATVLLFSCTAAFEFLANGMTIHRVMLQHAPAAALVAASGVGAVGARREPGRPPTRGG